VERLPKLTRQFTRHIWPRGVLIGALLLVFVFGGNKAQRIWGRARSLQGHIDELQMAADGGADVGLREVDEALRGARQDIEALRSEAASLLWLSRFLEWVPVVGNDLKVAPALLDVALSVTEAGTVAFDGLVPLIDLIEDGAFEEPPLAQVLNILSDARPALEVAQAQLAVAQERRSEIDERRLSTRTVDLIAQLDRYLPLMQSGLDGARLLPDLLGASDRRTYLILAQNSDELRATGGFIGAVGRLILEQGEIEDIIFEDSYAVDDFSRAYPDSPPAVLRYMGIDQWVFRDANWSPDFPTAAQKATQLYRISRELEVDGVLALDQHAVQTIVAALGPLDVEGWPESVTGENAISLMRLAWAPTDVDNWSSFDPAWWRQRKSFIGDLIGAMRTRIEKTPDEVNWMALGRAILEVLDERHLQVWLTDPANEATPLLAGQGWDGALRETTSDYLLAVDTNMGFNKANAAVQVGLDYRVLVDVDGAAQATLTVRHTNPSSEKAACDHWPRYGMDYEDLVNRCYWNYLRVYAPAGSRLSAATAHPVSADLLLTGQSQSGAAQVLPEENGKALFSSFFVLPHGEEAVTRFIYQLPHAVLERTDTGWRYRLLVQKQAGTHDIPLRVTLVLPPGAEVQSVVPTGDVHRPEPNVVEFDAILEKDRIFEVLFRQ
jgi:hypothetical protein